MPDPRTCECEAEPTLCPQPHNDDPCPAPATHNTLWTQECYECWKAKPRQYQSSEPVLAFDDPTRVANKEGF